MAVNFTTGWLDYLATKPPRAEYWACSHKVSCINYERGRHAAALYKFEQERCGGTINPLVSYKTARKTMSIQLRLMLDEERRWCRLRFVSRIKT